MAPDNNMNAVPGTVPLVDLAGTMATKHSKGHKDLVLVPVPSDDPDDPLNWSRWRKILSTISLAVFVSTISIARFTSHD
jgi:hypothetical protein